ncbi:hypothetical protein FSP39_004778 [Pinctada imbricata]|uniref:G-protein coupled receptors family 1 profile domain-containing protein n=1 Tax=Pinctada imbricata TaxID=66713 RepID=A0AA88Y2D9_PINIB|nr:hypothetical protein FSP39_004778 [Pinctada imbricata]
MVDDVLVSSDNESYRNFSGCCGNASEELMRKLLIMANDISALQLLPVIIYVGILMVAGAVGNAVVFYVYMYKMKNKSTTKGVFISSLAVLDLLVSCFAMPFEILDLRNQYCFSSGELCKVMRFLEYSIILSAGFTLVAVSADRYLNLCRRQSRFLFTPSRAKKVCIFCVCLSLCFSWPVIIFAGKRKVSLTIQGYEVEGTECTSFGEKEYPGMNAKIYLYTLNVVFIVSLLSMSTLYILISLKLFRRRKGTFHKGLLYLDPSSKSSDVKYSKKDVDFEKCGYAIGKRGIRMKGSTVIFYSVTVVFVLGYLPHLTVRLLKFSGYEYEINGRKLLYNFLVRSFLINSAANPFIYSLLHQRFREEVKCTFRRCLGCR